MITNDVIKKTSLVDGADMTAGYTKERELGLSKRAGKLSNKGKKLSYRKYSILCILNYRPFGKGKCNTYLL